MLMNAGFPCSRGYVRTASRAACWEATAGTGPPTQHAEEKIQGGVAGRREVVTKLGSRES
jgi:hypothetical protein